MNNETKSTKVLLMAIASIPSLHEKLTNKSEEYVKVLKEIQKTNFHKEDSQIPHMNAIAQNTGLPVAKVRSYIIKIYSDLVNLLIGENELNYEVTDVEYHFHINGKGEYVNYKGKLPVAPKVGENFEMLFLKAQFGRYLTYYVEEICHCIEDTVQVIHVSLRVDSFNLYKFFEDEKEKHLYPYDYWDKRKNE